MTITFHMTTMRGIHMKHIHHLLIRGMIHFVARRGITVKNPAGCQLSGKGILHE